MMWVHCTKEQDACQNKMRRQILTYIWFLDWSLVLWELHSCHWNSKPALSPPLLPWMSSNLKMHDVMPLCRVPLPPLLAFTAACRCWECSGSISHTSHVHITYSICGGSSPCWKLWVRNPQSDLCPEGVCVSHATSPCLRMPARALNQTFLV